MSVVERSRNALLLSAASALIVLGPLNEARAVTPPASALDFDASRYRLIELEVQGKPLRVRAFEGLPYVARPLDADSQVMNIYIPEAYFSGGSVAGYSAESAPIFLPNQIGGYMPSLPGSPERTRPGPPPAAMSGQRPPHAPPGADDMRAGQRNAIVAALLRGYVVASPGTRGRTSRDAQGRFTGKAPAALVDLKAAVRYLRFNDARMPGSAQRIVSNGTSAGGAMSALLGASGGSRDLDRELEVLGAAEADDHIFAVSAYCPITDLAHADAAYEWLFSGVRDYRSIEISMLDYKIERTEKAGRLSDAEVQISRELASLFPGYVNALGLRDAQGAELRLDDNGHGSFADYIKGLLMAAARKALAQGADIRDAQWLTVTDGRVVDVDLAAYAKDIGRLKPAPAFDSLTLTSGENQLFGDNRIDAMHFTRFSSLRSQVAGAATALPATVDAMNPLHYIGRPGIMNAAHWRIRHGTLDRDTSVAIPALLALKLRKHGLDVDFHLAWSQGHGGDYDLDELFDWVDSLSQAAR